MVQGYEHVGLQYLEDQEYEEEDIITERSKVPEIWYLDGGKYRRYFVDVYIPSQNTMIEIKSKWTLTKNLRKVLQKKKACEYAGYKYEIWVCSDKKILYVL